MITNWDDAYANAAYIDDAGSYPAKWSGLAAQFRKLNPPDLITYGPGTRNNIDLFRPVGSPRGLMVFIHGGYWMDFDKNSWSHLAKAATDAGFAVAIPSYDLAPDVQIRDITRQIGDAITVAAQAIDGPILLTGHSAGGHLVARMGCNDAPIPPDIAARITRITPISGLFDLRPLLQTSMAAILGLSAKEAQSESPTLLSPRQGFALTTWVGANERPEFLRQSSLLSNIWQGMGIETDTVIASGKHHFDIIDDLANPGSALCRAVLGT